ncbi:MAG: M48 family metallopeptidase [Phycisphaerales bacterium]
MDFFDHQDRARKRTGLLVVLFTMAVLAIIGLVYVVVSGFIIFSQRDAVESIFNPLLMLGVTGGTLAVVGFSSLYKIIELRSGGGSHVAEMLAGRLVDPSTSTTDDRRVLNVVEEMAIASGTAVPPVYVMENERAINAFAAGYSSDDAVIGLSRGSVDLLTRDELQGVVAHEFSHILNGDMRLNIKLIGLLNGILAIGLIGHMLMRAAAYSGGRRSSKDGGGAGAIILLGLGLLIVGSIGTFFGKWIKAAVSRQREFLADASAVQFTRNPDGIGGALKKIGAAAAGAKLIHPRAEEMSHMFFADGISRAFGSMFATHPPLPDRIRRVEPNWDGTFPKEVRPERSRLAMAEAEAEARKRLKAQQQAQQHSRIPGLRDRIPGTQALPGDLLGAVIAAGSVGSAVDHVGRPVAQHVSYATALVASIPTELKDAVHQTYTARAIIYTLLLNEEAEARAAQWKHIENHAAEGTFQAARSLEPALLLLDINARLPLLDMCMPALRQMSADQYQTFRANVVALIEMDQTVEVFEWALLRILTKHLDAPFRKKQQTQQRYLSVQEIGPHAASLLSNLAYAGNRDLPQVESAFAAGAAELRNIPMTLQPFAQISLAQLDTALTALGTMAPLQKRQLLRAAAATIAADRDVTAHEGELLRAISDVLDMPMPPILPGQKLI